MAVGRSKINGLKYYTGSYGFTYGKADKLREGKDGAIFALGYMAQIALKAADILASKGVEVSVYGVSCPLEPDMSAINEAVKTGHVMTIEDHNVNTGMGAVMVLESARKGIALPKLQTLGVNHYGESGTSDAVRDEMGLSAEKIADSFMKGR